MRISRKKAMCWWCISPGLDTCGAWRTGLPTKSEPITPASCARKNTHETVDVAKKEKDENIYPEINLSLSDKEMERYKTVFVGFPVWWYDVPMPVMTFLKQANLQGKNVYAFFSHEGSSDGAGSLPTLEKLMQTKGAAFDKKTALSVRGSKVKDSEAVVREWVKALSK